MKKSLRAFRKPLAVLIAAAALTISLPQTSQAYAVLTHQAMIDFSWKKIIAPALRHRYPSASDADIEASRAYAYGGAIIQDLGYFPFAGADFSNLAHYVRSGGFVEALIRDAQNPNEYAFALGALCHYCADSNGHPLATNRAVAVYFPILRHEFGDLVTYEDDQTAHSRAEFGFDVLRVARHEYPSEDYHDRKGFKVSKPLLERAFKDTYGLDLKHVVKHESLALWCYTDIVTTVIPHLSEIAWAKQHDQIVALYPDLTREKYIIARQRLNRRERAIEANEGPSAFDRFVAFVVGVFGSSFSKLNVKIPTKETNGFFRQSWEGTRDMYEKRIQEVDAGSLHLPDLDLDTGRNTSLGEYRLADQTYGTLLHSLAKAGFTGVDPALKSDILAFYSDGNIPGWYRPVDAKLWPRTLQEIARLKEAK
ncbi:MAG TPA: zinc dependent phospholipase C family protein [Blastocatellia bacterium]|nr:zinc dependent phospholipase C family protein [Blastocatellia bacterium]